jgi:3-deoxy-7-phosphoheptulonate synthase
MVKAHARSAMTMNFVRALIDGGFADLHHPEYWDLGWVEHSPLQDEYRRMVDAIGHSLRFMETLAGEPIDSFQRVDFYTSHEALVLEYEQALTRQVPRQWGWFDLSTHFPWIGMRTAAADGAHVEFCRGIRNPVAVKIGPGTTPDQLLRLADVLDPDHEPGRLAFVHRMGASRCGCATRCTATPRRSATAPRPAASRTSFPSWTRRSTRTAPPARASVACTSS